MKDREYKILADERLRTQAMAFTLSLFTTWRPDDDGDKDVDTALEYATKIYGFLKGESK